MAFSDNVWWTRKARIQAEKRILSNAFQAQVLLLWYSFAGMASSIYYLKFTSTPVSTDAIGTAWVVFSVLVMCISGFINGLSLKERAGLIKECYETLHGLYLRSNEPQADIVSLTVEYKQVLGVCENHTDQDYYLALCKEHILTPGKPDPRTGLKIGLNKAPTWHHWLSVVYWYIRHSLMLLFLYSLPVFIFIGLEFKK